MKALINKRQYMTEEQLKTIKANIRDNNHNHKNPAAATLKILQKLWLSDDYTTLAGLSKLNVGEGIKLLDTFNNKQDKDSKSIIKLLSGAPKKAAKKIREFRYSAAGLKEREKYLIDFARAMPAFSVDNLKKIAPYAADYDILGELKALKERKPALPLDKAITQLDKVMDDWITKVHSAYKYSKPITRSNEKELQKLVKYIEFKTTTDGLAEIKENPANEDDKRKNEDIEKYKVSQEAAAPVFAEKLGLKPGEKGLTEALKKEMEGMKAHLNTLKKSRGIASWVAKAVTRHLPKKNPAQQKPQPLKI
jgi:hypothetical protein